MNYYSPLRYPGGKARLSHYFKKIFDINSLYGGTYVEPYAGGASIALSLLIDGYVSKILINDFDKKIFAFWYSLINYTEELCRLINDTTVNVNNWKHQKNIQKESFNVDLLQLGFSTFFLNRCNHSGILDGGIIGGKFQTGEWKIDVRFNKNALIKRIQRIALYKSKIELLNLDAATIIERVINRPPEKTIIYFDPPYFKKGQALYFNYYEKKDHITIAEKISNISLHKWVVTYDNVNFIKLLYKPFQQIEYALNYSTTTPIEGEEIMIFSKNLIIPNIPLTIGS